MDVELKHVEQIPLFG